MSRTLVIRLSALGDAALLVPPLYSVAVAYPEDEFVLVVKSPLASVFERRPPNVRVVPAFAENERKGLRGLWRLIRALSALRIDNVADAHGVVRSRLIALFFRLSGKKTATIDKEKNRKKALTRKRNKTFVPLKTTVERYRDVFLRLGYDFSIDFHSLFDFGKRDVSLIEPVAGKKTGPWIGIAPFAKHAGKIYPPEKTEAIIDRLTARPDVKIFLFGGLDDAECLKQWETRHPQTFSVANRFSISCELILMSCLDVMLTMDSANMHLAALVETPVVSVWGATHPYAGFYGYRQRPENAVQSDLDCRPCSVFGNKPCFRNDYACLNSIPARTIAEKIVALLPNPSTTVL